MKKIKYSLSIKGKNEPLRVKEMKIKTKKGTNGYSVLNEKIGHVWETEDKELAFKVRENKGKWYDSNNEMPSHGYDELEILEITEINIVQVTEEIKQNTITDYFDEGQKTINEIEIKRINEGNEKKETTYQIKEEVREENNVQVKEKKKAQNSKTIKMIVECKETMYKELGQVVSKYATKEALFEKGKQYLGYVKEDKVYVLSSKKTPEYICEIPENEPKGNTLFDIYFRIKEVRE